MIYFLFLIIIVAAYNSMDKKIQKLTKENKQLRKRIAELTNGQPERAFEENIQHTVHTEEAVKPNVVYEETENVEEERIRSAQAEEKRAKETREKQNMSLLIVGAICIVIAALVFIMSAWFIMGNLFKTIVLVCGIGVFLGFSNTLDKKYHLKKASQTFFYIAMAYIPICFFAISVFRLFGDYLSFFGKGNFIYYTITSIITALIYFYFYIDKKDIRLLYSSVLVQYITVFLFAFIFDSNVLLATLLALIYNIGLIILTDKKNGVFKYFYNTTLVLAIIGALTGITDQSLLVVAISVLMAINAFILYYKDKKSVYSYLFNASVYFVEAYAIWGFDLIKSLDLQIILTSILVIITWVVENIAFTKIKERGFRNSNSVISILVLNVMFGLMFIGDLIGLAFGVEDKSLIKAYMIGIIDVIFLLINYICSKEKGKAILGLLIPIVLVGSTTNLLWLIDAAYYVYILIPSVMLLITLLMDKDDFKPLKNGIMFIYTLNSIFALLGAESSHSSELMNDVAVFLIVDLTYILLFFKNQSLRFYKYFAYVAEAFVFISLGKFLELGDIYFNIVPLLITAEIMYVEKKYPFMHDVASEIFILLSKMVSLIGILAIEGELKVVLLGTITVAMVALDVLEKSLTLNTMSGIIYLLALLANVENDYIMMTVILGWAAAYWYFMEDDRVKDIFKFIIYTDGLAFAFHIADEIELMDYTFVPFSLMIVYLLVSIKTILKKYILNTDNIEYLVFGIIYFLAFFEYNDEKDGMMFGLVLMAILLMSYYKKYGAMFVVTLVAIILNVLALTRMFWLIIPWWIYLLVVGGTLIGFAVKNESDENKKVNVGNVIKQLKDKVEK